MLPDDAVERSILPTHGQLLMRWSRIDVHMQFHDSPVERQECTQEPVEIISAD